MEMEKGLRTNRHYIVFRIGADTDIANGRRDLVQMALKRLEAKEDYVACLALSDALSSSAEAGVEMV